ncbi:D-erythronate dehydrogenase [Falsiphaeobacter marinintestinus]|uniref:D-erythronate dehydrogenase n=1 Tax=Falsiphaeobacter marinintestinus TaxID=1492905 RepID=UPI0011B54CB7|nr:D-erythronate dehydrogenase [Phaeobacter marinintestinus]
MKVLILGAAGVIGQKLGQTLAQRGHLRGETIDAMVLADVVAAKPFDAPFPLESVACDISNPASVAQVIGADVDVIYLLAAVVSSHAEEVLDDGLNINMMGTFHVLQRCRELETAPVVVFSSSNAVYGGEVPDPIIDETFLNPQTSYGTQKAIGELLLNDFSRRGLIDGRGFRLPTISVRPGKPNRAASGFMSSILREPLNGQEAICPVSEEFSHYYLSPRKCVENLIKGTEIPAEDLGENRCMIMPGKQWTIRQVIDAMTAVVGPEPAKLIKWESQPEIERIVTGWRFDFQPQKSLKLGLEADNSFEDNIRYYIEDDQPFA